MSLIFILPAFISLFFVWRRRVERAVLSVYLPCLLLLPYEYSVRLPHLPPFSTAEYALIPLGIVALLKFSRSRSFVLMDVLVLLYTLSIALSEILHEPVRNDGILYAMTLSLPMLFAYAVGRQFIEPNLRFEAVRRIVIFVLLNGFTNLYEWRMSQSPYGIAAERIFGLSLQYGGGMQMRNGHGRVGAVFGGGECAGIAFAMAFCLNGWLAYLNKVRARVNLGKKLKKLEKYHVAGLLLLLYVFATQSRGPEIALFAGILILQIVRFKKTRLTMVLVAILLVAGYFGAKAFFDHYTSVAGPENEQQGSALYRKEMNKVYAPIADAGGWTGYSVPGIPHVEGLYSIDNHYLLVHLAWGRLAYLLLLWIAFENIRVIVMGLWRGAPAEDQAFMVSMLAAMAVLWITLMTVFLGSQLPEFSFFLLGWMQAAARQRASKAAPQELTLPAARFSFRRVYT